MEPIKKEYLKKLRLGFQYQRAFEEAFQKYKIGEIFERLRKELYGIDSDSEEATKKKI